MKNPWTKGNDSSVGRKRHRRLDPGSRRQGQRRQKQAWNGALQRNGKPGEILHAPTKSPSTIVRNSGELQGLHDPLRSGLDAPRKHAEPIFENHERISDATDGRRRTESATRIDGPQPMRRDHVAHFVNV